ncbi:PaaI family thioesterase [Pendulispora albinea]|uniref:Acyl-coenzyme A thioesterase THEM4 n=1 Tax=Pendulispora albinea TaxID=2741071 RepID=A0ABZ2M168_9BACT
MPHLHPEPLDPFTFGESQPCFGCAPDHPTGFRLRFSRIGDEEVTTTFLPGEGHQGPPGIMHGGLVTTLADEIAAWAVIGLLGKFGFTATMEAKFHRPIRIGTSIDGRARIVKQGTRVITVEVSLVQENIQSYTGKFTFAVLDRAGTERLLQRPLPEAWARFGR